MPKELILRGVPRSIARDGWWLASEANEADDHAPLRTSSKIGGAMDWRVPGVAGLTVLVALGDFLFWGYLPGVSLIIFAWAVFAVAVVGRPAQRGLLHPTALLVLASLPLFEHVQPLSLGILGFGLLGAVAWLRVAPDTGPILLVTAFVRLVETLPVAGALSCTTSLRDLRANTVPRRLLPWLSDNRLLQNWAFPLGGVLVLSALLFEANPVLEHALVQLFQFDLDVFTLVRRVVFWAGLGLLIWPFLIAPTPKTPLEMPALKPGLNLGLNAGSVLRALILFNLFLALQSVLDISILFGGADLPDGMSHAAYAHRGAYPLLATAMLAGAFALATRPFLSDYRALKPLLLLWLLQNVLLTLSAALRLDLYIDAFGLTYLRLHALIWMGLVALGLLMVGWQVLRDHSSLWLLLRTTGLGVGTLYACAFINFAALIATDILDRATDPTNPIGPDWDYLCDLGPMASTAIVQGMRDDPNLGAPNRFRACLQPKSTHRNWREWDFRTGRINGYLENEMHLRATLNENSVGG